MIWPQELPTHPLIQVHYIFCLFKSLPLITIPFNTFSLVLSSYVVFLRHLGWHLVPDDTLKTLDKMTWRQRSEDIRYIGEKFTPWIIVTFHICIDMSSRSNSISQQCMHWTSWGWVRSNPSSIFFLQIFFIWFFQNTIWWNMQMFLQLAKLQLCLMAKSCTKITMWSAYINWQFSFSYCNTSLETIFTWVLGLVTWFG